MQDQHVSVGVVEKSHQEDACVDGIPEKLDSLGDELLARDVHVGCRERGSRSVRCDGWPWAGTRVKAIVRLWGRAATRALTPGAPRLT